MFFTKCLTHHLGCLITQNTLLCALLSVPMAMISHAQTPQDELYKNNEAIQDERQKRLIPNPNVYLTDNTADKNKDNKGKLKTHQDTYPLSYMTGVSADLPCFTIHTIAFNTLNASPHDSKINDSKLNLSLFNDALSVFKIKAGNKGSFLGHCLNINDIQTVATIAQNRLIDKGFVTTKVVIADQDLSAGALTLSLVVGRVGDILVDTKASKIPVYTQYQPQPIGSHIINTDNANPYLPAVFSNAVTLQSGDILNIRQLETTLENLKRVPSSDANFEIIPSGNDMLGFSDILIHYNQDRRYRTSLQLDDAGSKSTGKYQSNLTLSIDNIANHNDLLYLSYGYSFADLDSLSHKLQDKPINPKKHSHNYSMGYALPVDNWLISLGAGQYSYAQTVAGINQDYIYGGTSNNGNVSVSYLAGRNSHSKTYLTAGGFVKGQKSFIDDTEIEVQRRKIAGWTAGIKHDTRLKNTQLGFSLSYRRGTGAFDAITPAESLFNEGDSRVGIFKLNTDIYHSFAKAQGKISYDGMLKAQYAPKALAPSERMSIGGRYSVRGFNGERTLSADNGVLLRQNLNFTLPTATQGSSSHRRLYLGLDAGFVKMTQSAQDELLLGNTLVGSAIGLKGQFANPTNRYQSINYDVFASYPLKAPDGFFGRQNGKDKDGQWVWGFSLGVGF